MKRLKTYLEEVWSELKKVSFPTKKETWEMAVLVMVVSGLIAFYVSFADLGFSTFVKWLMAS